MQKTLLIIIFITGLKTAIAEWKIAYQHLIGLYVFQKRGFHPSDFLTYDCENMKHQTEDEILSEQKKDYNFMLKNIKQNTTYSIVYCIFITCVTLLSLYNYLQLTIKF